ncbi:transposase [Planosporangium mesophilum]|nr:transposase [Planosporangium mesophilum]
MIFVPLACGARILGSAVLKCSSVRARALRSRHARGHERILSEYTRHYNGHRPHRSLGQRPPDPPTRVVGLNAARVQRRPILRGLINEYSQAA